MAKLIGSIDELGRPLLRLSLPGGRDDLLAIVATGFNGQLMMSMSVARSLQVQLEDLLVKVELGTGAMEDVYVGHLDIVWLDRPVRARTLVSEGWPAPKPDAPAALIGTRLLRPHLLTIDFDADTVEVEPQA